MLAESPQIPVGLVILVLVVFLLTVVAAAAVVIGGWIAAYRCARDPTRTKARVVASVCATVETLALAASVLWLIDNSEVVPFVVAAVAVLATTATAFALGRSVRARSLSR